MKGTPKYLTILIVDYNSKLKKKKIEAGDMGKMAAVVI